MKFRNFIYNKETKESHLLGWIFPEVFKPNSFFFKERLKLSICISMFGLICNEFITIFTPGRGVFDWNDILWTLIGGGVFLIIHRKINEVV